MYQMYSFRRSLRLFVAATLCISFLWLLNPRLHNSVNAQDWANGFSTTPLYLLVLCKTVSFSFATHYYHESSTRTLSLLVQLMQKAASVNFDWSTKLSSIISATLKD